MWATVATFAHTADPYYADDDDGVTLDVARDFSGHVRLLMWRDSTGESMDVVLSRDDLQRLAAVIT